VTGFLASRAVSASVVQTVRVADEHPISLDVASARNLRFLDREEEIIYPWTREGLACRQIRAWGLARTDDKEQMIWAAS